MMANNPVKSKFRGVYKCGKQWKAQLQCQGIKFHLGTFDTAGEAAKAYDRKAKDEKGVDGLTNYDENGEEAMSCNSSGISFGARGPSSVDSGAKPPKPSASVGSSGGAKSSKLTYSVVVGGNNVGMDMNIGASELGSGSVPCSMYLSLSNTVASSKEMNNSGRRSFS